MLEMVPCKGKDMEVMSACFSSSAACLRDSSDSALVPFNSLGQFYDQKEY